MASFATLNSNDCTMAFSKIKHFNLREKLPGTIAIVSGLLVSLWTQCIVLVLYLRDNRYAFENSKMVVEKMVIMYCQVTYCIVIIFGIASLCYALNNNDKTFVYPWLATKVVETIIALVGTILLAMYGHYTGLMFPGLLCLLIGSHLSLCAWRTIKNMPAPLPPAEETTQHQETVVDEKPPAYDNFTN